MVTPETSKDDISCWFKTRKSSILHPRQEYWIFIFCRHRRTNQRYSTGSQEKQPTISIPTASGKWIENWNLRRDSTNTQFGFTTIFSVDFHNSPSKNTNSWRWFFVPFQRFSEHGYAICRRWQHRTNGMGITSIYKSIGICAAIPDANGLQELIKNFPTFTTPFKHSDEIRHTAKLYITTSGSPTHA